MTEKVEPKASTLPSIGIRRIDGVTFELYTVTAGVKKTVIKETFSIVNNRAADLLQAMAEGRYRE